MIFPLRAEASSDEYLVAELHRLGVRHLARFDTAPAPRGVEPVGLISALAAHPEARMQGALILLFLQRPDYQAYVPAALQRLDRTTGYSLKLFYQAAVYLQRELAAVLRPQTANWRPLPDHFSPELGLPHAVVVTPGYRTADGQLQALGDLHRCHTGQNYNWAGSYRQHIGLFLKHLASDNA